MVVITPSLPHPLKSPPPLLSLFSISCAVTAVAETERKTKRNNAGRKTKSHCFLDLADLGPAVAAIFWALLAVWVWVGCYSEASMEWG